MPVYKNGKKIVSIYHKNRNITEVYHKGNLVFTTKRGWVRSGTIRYTINSNNNNSIAGTMDLIRYDYYENASITKTYYEVSNKTLARETEGVLTLSIPAGSNIVFGFSLNSAEYPVPSTGTITLSASEFANLYRINKNDSILNLTSSTISSFYLEPVQDMTMLVLGSGLFINEGWAIASNRSSRIKVSTGVSVSSLYLPSGDGMWPVYAVAQGGTDVNLATLTCDTGVHFIYESQNMRHLGWVIVQGGRITNVINYNNGTTGNLSRSIDGTSLTVSAGYATDTSGCRVYVPNFTYDFSALITLAQDTKETGSFVTIMDYSYKSGAESAQNMGSGSSPESIILGLGSSYGGKTWTDPINGPCIIRVRTGTAGRRPAVPDYPSYKNGYVNKYRFYEHVDFWNPNPPSYIDSTKGGSGGTWVDQEIPSGMSIENIGMDSDSYIYQGQFTVYRGLRYAPITEIPGTRQVVTVYAKITRSQNDNSKTVSSQTNTDSSVPFVSYVPVGTITVERNASTGTLS